MSDKSTPIQLMGLLVIGFIFGKQLEINWLFPTTIIITLIIATLDITFKFIIPMFKKDKKKGKVAKSMKKGSMIMKSMTEFK